jgi:hypothetical protein
VSQYTIEIPVSHSFPLAPGTDPSKAFEDERKIMVAYSDTAKTYSQLSLGALVLSITFIEKVVAATVPNVASSWLYAAWCNSLVAALSGAFYQYLAVRFLELRGEDWGVLKRSGHPQALEWLARHPWPAYTAMLLAFAVGSISFVVFGIRVLPVAR